MKTYLDLLRLPGVSRLMASGILSRFQYGLMSVSLVLFFYDRYHSYALASIALGAETIGVGISGPWLGRQLVNWGIRRTLIICTAGVALLLTLLVLVEIPAAVAVALCLAVGIATPPVQQSARLIFEPLVGQTNLKTLFSFDAISQELIWVVGPVAATLLSAKVSAQAPIWLIIASGVVGTAWFVTHPKFHNFKIDRHDEPLGGILQNAKFILILLLGTLLVAGFSAVEIGTIGAVDRTAAGFSLAMFSVGSVIGGLAFGHRATSNLALAKFAATVTAGYCLSLIFPTNALWLALCWTIAGLGVAPMLGLLSHLISKLLSPSAAAEGYGWMGTGQLIGYSAAAAACGFALDYASAEMVFAIGISLGAVTTLVAVLVRNALPALEGN